MLLLLSALLLKRKVEPIVQVKCWSLFERVSIELLVSCHFFKDTISPSASKQTVCRTRWRRLLRRQERTDEMNEGNAMEIIFFIEIMEIYWWFVIEHVRPCFFVQQSNRLQSLRGLIVENKELIIAPTFTLVPQLFSLPIFFASLLLACQTIETSSIRYLFIVSCFAAFIPQFLTFFLYVKPSTFYSKQWHSTYLSQRISNWTTFIRSTSTTRSTLHRWAVIIFHQMVRSLTRWTWLWSFNERKEEKKAKKRELDSSVDILRVS